MTSFYRISQDIKHKQIKVKTIATASGEGYHGLIVLTEWSEYTKGMFTQGMISYRRVCDIIVYI